MSFEVKRAKRQRRPLKISLEGLSGSGKTFTALRLAFALRRAGIGKRIVVADSENESAGLYDGISIDGEVWQYETCAIPHEKQNPAGYAECYEYLVGQGFDLLIFDSLSHAWHGAVEQVDAFARANRGDKFGGWAKVTPDQRQMLTTLTDPRAHLIATMRVKSEYERVERGDGRAAQIKKVGMKTDQREGAEYEFDVVVRLDSGHEAHVEKVRGCTAMDNKSATRPGPDFWKPLCDWWLSADPVKPLAALYVDEIRAAPTLDALRAVMARVNADVTAKRVPAADVDGIIAAKDRRKAELTPAPVTEGERRADFTPPTAPAPKPTPTIPPTPTATPAKPTDPAPRPTAPAANAAWPVLELLHALDLAWPEVRDAREGRGREVADAAGLGRLPPGHRITDLTDAERGRLVRELDARVEEKKRRAAQRAANRARREAEEGVPT